MMYPMAPVKFSYKNTLVECCQELCSVRGHCLKRLFFKLDQTQDEDPRSRTHIVFAEIHRLCSGLLNLDNGLLILH